MSEVRTLPAKDGKGTITISRATVDDVPAIKQMVNESYAKYVERIGKPPAPMTADYEALLKTHDVFVLRPGDSSFSSSSTETEAVGSIVLQAPQDSDALQINNLVVSVASQGKGYGRILMNLAEEIAKEKGRVALELFTNVKMWENIGLYAKLGFDETERKVDSGYERVYFRKELSK
jgi:ribosomal protein S18 acetylase RimI-like enzyme